mmetsp:Transcript_108712/g.306363  ORF Transcript_108712/g.306363 Transcript_108712/m.306363 type:complete len:280 (+) Transcript_108712:844-1683(+)
MMDMSASFVCLSVKIPERRQTSKKESPMFLFGAPWYSSTQPCTISPTWFTKTITFSFNTSVACMKFLMQQKPMMASTFEPGTIAFTPALAPPFMFWPMISAPASPKPSARRPPSLIIVFSKMTVSIGSFIFFCWHFLKYIMSFPDFASCSRRFAFSISSRRYSRSPKFMASKGLSLIASIFAIMRSMGFSSSVLASLENVMAPMPTTKQMKIVCNMLRPASSCVMPRMSKAKTMSTSLPSLDVRAMGVILCTSVQRSSSMEHSEAYSAATAVFDTETPR